MYKRQFIKILRRYGKGIATDEERKFIESYYDLFDLEPEEIRSKKDQERIKEKMLNEVWEKIQQKQGRPGKERNGIRPVSVAASILVVLASGIFIYLISSRQNRQQNLAKQASIPDEKGQIHPGGNKAILTLANGQKIILDSAQTGSLIKQGNVNIVKLNSGLLAYNTQHATRNTRQIIQYNTITTPRGGQYKIVLADGSKVWLNAASSLRFPTAFTGEKREVKMQGEAYFEVAKNTAKPFIVSVEGITVKVLGTHFNVYAYSNENIIRTTLAEGAVSLSRRGEGQPAGQTEMRLKPGEQAQLDKQTGNISVKKVNVNKMLAWKNNLFYFEDTNIKEIMGQVARWYDVEVVYATKQLKNKNFSGIISRYKNIDELLKRMELTGTIHFKVEGKVITVMD